MQNSWILFRTHWHMPYTASGDLWIKPIGKQRKDEKHENYHEIEMHPTGNDAGYWIPFYLYIYMVFGRIAGGLVGCGSTGGA